MARSLSWIPISEAVDSALRYIEGRKKGDIKSMKTSFEKLNNSLLGGVEWNRIFTIGGLSGSGKSVALEQIRRDFSDLNPNENFEILSFEFEMLSRDQVTRSLSAKLQISTKDIYSGEVPLEDKTFNLLKEKGEEMKKYPIFYVDTIGSVDEIVDTIIEFSLRRKLAETKKKLIVTIDHILLTQGKEGELEKAIIDKLYKGIVYIRKFLITNGIDCIFILLAQLNREIETMERKTKPEFHYPTKNDLFGASSIFQCSDYLLVTHKPASIDGIANWYGPPRKGFPYGLPLFNPKNSDQPMVYWHLLKERFGKPKILMMLDDFHNSSIREYTNE